MEVNYVLADIAAAAEQLLAYAGDQKVFAFYGEMGAGKTTFIHALCAAMQVTDTVTSPTFSIINQYQTAAGETVYHMDLYRLKNAEDAINAGVEDCLFSGDCCLVEWPEKAPGLFPDEALQVYITVLNSSTRRLVVDEI